MKKLRELRKQYGIKMKDIAQMINVSESAISQYETGKREPDFHTLRALAEYFNVTTDYLLDCNSESDTSAQANKNNIVAIARGGERVEYILSDDDTELIKKLLDKIKSSNQ